ncbi:soma ferritin [Orussus abietinus]|uniref:soma ferritin n=1 Tax=Orussus abietinus TaxID=222816 RepID=UPI0006255BEA|nr:soma ferritin [Orussus abietinus]
MYTRIHNRSVWSTSVKLSSVFFKGSTNRIGQSVPVCRVEQTISPNFLLQIVHYYHRDLQKSFAMSLARQKFHEECEAALNKQINLELYSSYVYLSMAYHFDRCDVALQGLHKYFKSASDEEREHAMKFMTYQNKRGGSIVLTDIKAPEKDNWGTAKEAMVEALNLEKKVNDSLLELHALASGHNDPNFVDFLETEFLQEQVDAIKEIADHVTNLERVGEGLGVFVFDKELHESSS